ncbi:receptor-like protein 9DC1 [Solanum stenotomum]|uniref:receptor-like protein 9DC1 n=1 Tax=Solanum stenotomum TaxID=172797 RepID=UPI0020D08715|nr:receptor-like protein 9DC1 [Solanum stenotomum]
MNPIVLDEEGDSAIINWQAVLMGYGCGLVIGLSIICIMLSTQYPAWFSRMDAKSTEFNLSHNVLEGHIPVSLHQLSVLESFDLSSNKISGEIPQQLASLTSLEVLNLSHNHLVGCIPKGKQFDTLENSSYQGNDRLRGFPLSKDCGGDEGVPQAITPYGLDQEEEEGDSAIISWQAVLMGYVVDLLLDCP